MSEGHHGCPGASPETGHISVHNPVADEKCSFSSPTPHQAEGKEVETDISHSHELATPVHSRWQLPRAL